jgi:hypothetical protein
MRVSFGETRLARKEIAGLDDEEIRWREPFLADRLCSRYGHT